ncbi:MAG: hypothetical protein GY750_14270, partial [Lentisphaerae bacterium]|nr:hypothetical protein [Lentisphaerota bacterium]
HRSVKSRIRVAVSNLSIKQKVSPADWAEENVDFKHVVSARIRSKLDLSLTPYLRGPIDAWDFTGTRREVTVCAPEQTGKTLAWVCRLLWTFIFQQCLYLVCYESDDKKVISHFDFRLPNLEMSSALYTIPSNMKRPRWQCFKTFL